MLQLQVKKEKSTTSVTYEEVKNYIPDDLSFSILSKLPIKSLKRFGCVSKSWALLFENSHFMGIFRNKFIHNHDSYYDYTSLFLHQFYRGFIGLYSLFGESFENRVQLDLPNPLQETGPLYYMLDSGSINGTLLLYMPNIKFIMWNPSTKEFKVIPRSPCEVVQRHGFHRIVIHGFGYDYIANDYKLIRYVYLYELYIEDEDLPYDVPPFDPLWEIYSLRSNSWRKLDVDIPRCHDKVAGERLYIDGMCHWLGFRDNDEHWLVSFNLSNEVFCTTHIPFDIDFFDIPPFDIDDSFYFVSRYLVVLYGSISLISWYDDTTTFHISVLGELGVEESWTKLFIVRPLPCVKRPIGVGNKGNIFFIQEDGEIVLFNLSTHMIVELGVKGDPKYGEIYIVIYKESLLPILKE